MDAGGARAEEDECPGGGRAAAELLAGAGGGGGRATYTPVNVEITVYPWEIYFHLGVYQYEDIRIPQSVTDCSYKKFAERTE
jgi:hypothetical protein